MDNKNIHKKNDLWVKDLKNSLDDYSAPLPENGWDKMNQRLNQRAVRKSRKLIYLRVASIAAMLVLISSATLFLFQFNVDDEVLSKLPEMPLKDSSETSTELKTAKQTTLETFAQSKNQTVTSVNTVKKPSSNRNTVLSSKSTEKIESKSKSVTAESDKKNENRDETLESTTKKEVQSSKKSTEDKKVKSYTKFQNYEASNKELYTSPIKKEKTKKWALAMAVSSGALGNQHSDASSFRQFSSTKNLNNNEMLEDAGLTEKIALMQTFAESPIYEYDHHQPITFSLSFNKFLNKRFSLETGLTYTLLKSDVTMVNDMASKFEQELHYLGIPIKANWHFVNTRYLNTYLGVGGTIEKCIYGKFNHEYLKVSPLQFSVLGVVGIQYNISEHLGAFGELGVDKYFNDGSDVQTIRKKNDVNLHLQFGLRLSY